MGAALLKAVSVRSFQLDLLSRSVRNVAHPQGHRRELDMR